MNHKIVRAATVAALVCLSFGITFGQGLYWESTTTAPIAGAKEIHSTSCYRSHMFKQTSGNESMIFRLDKGMVVQIDNDRKEYSEMTFDELEAQAKEASSTMDAKMAEMKKSLANVPPEQRKMIEQMMGDKMKGIAGDAKIDVAKTSEAKMISGFGCTKCVVTEDGKEFATVWSTAKVPDFGAMKDDFKEFSQRMTSLMPSKGSSIAVGMKKIDGFAIQTTIAGITTTVTKVEKRPVAASEFEVPSGYTKVKADFFNGRSHQPQGEQKSRDGGQKEQK